MRIFIGTALFLLLSSCAFNKSFYHPDIEKVSTPPGATSHYIKYNDVDSIHSLYYAKEDPIASIFFLHGNAGNLSSWSEIADLFNQAGYEVFIFDYPGFGNSTGKTSHENVYKATNAATTYYENITLNSDKKKLLMGFSLGGNLAVKIGSESPDLFDAMIIEGAFESHQSISKNKVSRPLKGIAGLLVKNNIKGNELIKHWKKPLLIIHSKDDRVCPYENGRSLYENAVNASKRDLWTIKGPHLAGLGQNFDLYLLKMEALINSLD